jgi:hypothetical protein
MKKEDASEVMGDRSQQEGRPATEFGICYDAPGCPSGSEIDWSCERSACQAAGGKSWKGSQSSCVNLP